MGTSSSLGLLAVQYSSSEGEEVSSPHSKIATSEALPVPDAILGWSPLVCATVVLIIINVNIDRTFLST